MNDAYLGGDRTGGKAGRGSENRILFLRPFPYTTQDTQLVP